AAPPRPPKPLSPVIAPWRPTLRPQFFFSFFFNDTAPPEISPLPLHAALPISLALGRGEPLADFADQRFAQSEIALDPQRSEEHTSELQSPVHLVCRLLLE